MNYISTLKLKVESELKRKTVYEYKHLNFENLNKIKKICEQWLCPYEDNGLYLAIYEYSKNIDFTIPIKAFTERLDEINYDFSSSEKVSGSVCFYGGVLMSLLNYGYIKNIDDIFSFSLFYILVDHFIDNPDNTDEMKYKAVDEIYNFISGDHSKIKGNKMLEVSAERFLNLVEKNPKCKEHFIDIFNSEIKGVLIQKQNHLHRNEYEKIANEKGGLSAASLGTIINSNYNDDYLLGSIIQLVDDFMDLQQDIDENIYTLARYDYDNKYMDEYIYMVFDKIESLPRIYNFFKPILLMGLMLGIHDYSDCVGNELYQIVKPYIPFDENTSKDTLVELFHSKLYEMKL